MMIKKEEAVEQRGNVTIRRAHSKDAGAIGRLHADSWRRHYRGAYSDTFLDGDVVADRLQVWTEHLNSEPGTSATFIAESEGDLAGFVHLIFDEDPEWGSLVDNLHVVWERKRLGIGTLLMSMAAATVLERGSGGLYLWVLEQNTAAWTFYSSCGGTCTGRRLVTAPGGVPNRLEGSPMGLRYSWRDPATLIV